MGGYDLGNVHGKITLDASGVTSGIQSARQALNTGFANMGDSLQSFGDQLTGVGARLTALTAPFTAFAASGVKVAADFDVLMKQIELFGGVSGEELNSVREFALQMGADTKFSAQDAGSALLDLLKSGQDLNTAMSNLPDVLNLAAAGEMSLASAAGITATSLAMFQMDTERLNQSLIAVPDNFEELQKQLGITDAMFTAFGQEELGTQLDAFAEQLGVSAWDVYAMWDQTKVLTPELSSLADQLGITTLNWAQLSEALYENKGFGYETALTPAMEELSRLTDLDVAQLADMFMEGISPSARIVDALAQAANASRAEVSDLGQALTNVGPVANNFGMDVEEVAATLAVLADNGLMGAEAGTQLKSMLLNMSRPTREVKAAYKELGVSMYNTNGTVKDFNTFILELDTALDGLPVKRQNELMQALGGSYGIVGLSAIRASNGIGDMLAEMATAPEAGALAEGFMGTFAGKVESLRGSFETLKIQAMTPFMNEVLAPLVERLTSAVNAVTAWTAENPELTTTIMQIGTALAVAGPGLMATGLAVSNIGFAVKTVAPLFGLLTSPLGLMAGAGLVLAEVFDIDLKQAFEDTLAIVMPALEALRVWFVEDALPAVVDFVQNTFLPIVGQMASAIGDTWSRVYPVLEGIYNWFVNDAIPAIVNIIENTFIPIIQDIGKRIGEIWAVIAPVLVQIYDWFVTTAIPAVATAIQTIFVPAVQFIADVFREVYETVAPILQFLVTWFVEQGIPIIVGIIEAAVPVFQTISDVLGAIWSVVGPVLQSLLDWFQTTGFPFIESIINEVITPAITTMIDLFSGIWSAIEPTIQQLVDFWEDTLGPVIQFVVEKIIIPAVNLFTGIIQAILPLVEPALNLIKDVFVGVFTWIADHVIKPLVDTILSIPRAVDDALKAIERFLQGDPQTKIGSAAGQILSPGGFQNMRGGITTGNSQQDLQQSGVYQASPLLGALHGLGVPPQRDSGGEGLALMPYLIGKPQENNEIFVPRATGDFIPNFMEKLELFMNQGQQGITIDTVVIHADTPEGGKSAGDAFVQRLKEFERSQG